MPTIDLNASNFYSSRSFLTFFDDWKILSFPSQVLFETEYRFKI